MVQPAPLVFRQQFRLTDSTIVTTHDTTKDIAVSIPAGAVFTLEGQIPVAPFEEPTRRVNIVWNGHEFSMFLIDVVEKAEPL